MNREVTLRTLASEVTEFISAPRMAAELKEERFTALACALFRFQFEHIPVYARFCLGRGIDPGKVRSWEQIPALPTAAFKEFELTSLAPEDRTCVFFSSGTSQPTQRSRHFHGMDSLRVYEASLLKWFQPHLLPECTAEGARGPMVNTGLECLALTPPPEVARNSSLVHMIGAITRRFHFDPCTFVGQIESDGGWLLNSDCALELLRLASAAERQVLLLGPAFAFVQLLDFLAAQNASFSLAPGSRVMETGGYKGRTRVLPRLELHNLIAGRLGIAPGAIVTEYGMSELSSQGYDRAVGQSKAHPGSVGGILRFPPWARAQVISPETGLEVSEGGIGLVRVLDLANVSSVAAVQTEDLAIRRGGGFELLGRAPHSEPRGCSLMLSEPNR